MTRSKTKVAAAKDGSVNPSGELCSCPRPNLKGPESTGKKSSKTVKPTAEPSQPVLPISERNSESEDDSQTIRSHSPDTPESIMTEKFVEDLTRILAEQNGHLVAELHKQMLALSNTVEGATLSNSTPKYNSAKCSGEPDEDVNEFITNYDRAARFHKWNDEPKAEAFPLHLLENASVWFNTTPDLAGKSYQDMTDALQRQFHSDSDLWQIKRIHARSDIG